MTTVIATRGLTKHFGRVHAVDGIDLDVRAGDVYGFLGANGSGKTTTVRMLLGLVLATSGEVAVLGQRMPRAGRQVLPRVGALIEGPAAYGHLSGRENLALLDASGPGGGRRTRGHRIDEVLDQVGLSGVGKRPVRAYSLGMRQRLGLAGALLRRPELLVLDEPTNGLDPQGIAEVRELLLELNRAGTTVFLSSHLLAEVEQMATRVGVLNRGRLVLQEQLDVLTAPTGCTVVNSPDPGRVQATMNGRVSSIDGDRIVITGDPAEINARLVGAGVSVTGLALERPTLEAVVLAAAGASTDRVETKVSEHRRRPMVARERGRVSIEGAPAPRSGATPERAMGEERSEPGVDQ
jgi:ABC-type multidrug transport system ATPase subunit